jgi:hypothetical protein
MRRKTPTRSPPIHSRENSGYAMQSFFGSSDSLPPASATPDTVFSPTTLRMTVAPPYDRRFRYRLSALQQSLVAFCLLTGAIALFIGYMMKNSASATFTVPFVEHHWNRNEKGEACRRAGLAYFFLVLLTLLRPFLDHHRLQHYRHLLWSRCRKSIPKERLAMLGYSRKGSDGSEDEDEEME